MKYAQTSASIGAGLLADGWNHCPNQFKNYSVCYYKRFDTPNQCHCNDDKEGMQIELAVSEYEGRVSMELELCGELADGTWMKVQNYCLPSKPKYVKELIPRMLAVWEAANKEGAK